MARDSLSRSRRPGVLRVLMDAVAVLPGRPIETAPGKHSSRKAPAPRASYICVVVWWSYHPLELRQLRYAVPAAQKAINGSSDNPSSR